MTIFLSGAHGVGKTYLAERTAERLQVQHLSASQLIQEEKGRSTWTPDRRVQNVSENQDALIAAVQRRSHGSTRLLLDGHFVLRDSLGGLVRLDVDVFSRLRIVATVLIEAPHQVVADRLSNRGGRIEELSSLQAIAQAEREHATYVCSLLDLPLISLQSPTEDEFATAVERILRNVSQS